MLAATTRGIYSVGDSLTSILVRASSAEAARRALVEAVVGFGPKQASLYLRRVGYCSGMAVLDSHVLDYMELRTGVQTNRRALAHIEGYEAIEAEFRRIASGLGSELGLVDLAMWITMRVAKREALI
jgi:N-glycosylase/DNA lyase